jgi:capsular exopolysaccharide synthesis family protein
VYLESLAEEIKVGERRLAELNKLFDEEHRLAANLASFEAQEEAFHNEIDRLRRLFNDTMKRVEEIDLLKDYGGISAEPISPPLPGSLIRPKLPVIFGFSAFSGLFLGLALAYLIDLGDKRLRSEEDVCRDIGLTVLGHIPLLPRNQGRRRTRPGGPALHPALCVYHQPAGPEAEAFRALRTALSCGRLKDDCKVIQVSSPTPGDGKTFVAVNLAISLATSGKKVLLLDTDLRHPTVHEQLALPNDTGLSSVLEGHSEILAAIQETAVANLWAMSSGPIPRHPAELLGSPGFKEVLDVVRDRYDLVVVDASPLLTVSDPAIIAPAMDGVLLVTRLGQRKGDQRVMQVIDTLNLLGIRPLGIVMNGSDQRASYGYGSYHYDGDYNGERYQAVH